MALTLKFKNSTKVQTAAGWLSRFNAILGMLYFLGLVELLVCCANLALNFSTSSSDTTPNKSSSYDLSNDSNDSSFNASFSEEGDDDSSSFLMDPKTCCSQSKLRSLSNYYQSILIWLSAVLFYLVNKTRSLLVVDRYDSTAPFSPKTSALLFRSSLSSDFLVPISSILSAKCSTSPPPSYASSLSSALQTLLTPQSLQVLRAGSIFASSSSSSPVVVGTASNLRDYVVLTSRQMPSAGSVGLAAKCQAQLWSALRLTTPSAGRRKKEEGAIEDFAPRRSTFGGGGATSLATWRSLQLIVEEPQWIEEDGGGDTMSLEREDEVGEWARGRDSRSANFRGGNQASSSSSSSALLGYGNAHESPPARKERNNEYPSSLRGPTIHILNWESPNAPYLSSSASYAFDDSVGLFQADSECLCLGHGFRDNFLDGDDDDAERGADSCCCKALKACCWGGRVVWDAGGWVLRKGGCYPCGKCRTMTIVFSPVGGAAKWMKDNSDLVQCIQEQGRESGASGGDEGGGRGVLGGRKKEEEYAKGTKDYWGRGGGTQQTAGGLVENDLWGL